jgi:hypothetical protein
MALTTGRRSAPAPSKKSLALRESDLSSVSSVYFASAEVKALPLWNLTPSRRRKV